LAQAVEQVEVHGFREPVEGHQGVMAQAAAEATVARKDSRRREANNAG